MKRLSLTGALRRGDFRLDVDTDIPAAGVTGVFGASGAGKTSLLRCLAGLEADADPTPPHRRRIGYVFQRPALFPHLDVRGNVHYGWRRAGREADVDAIVARLGLEPLLTRRPATLSGGEAQRVAIARALAMAPTLILMDEPLASLDRPRKDDLLPYLDGVCAETKTPIVYVSHDVDEICRLCDHLLVMEDGRVVAEGELQATLTRTDIAVLGGANAGTVIPANCRERDAADGLARYGFSGGEIIAPAGSGGDDVRLRIRASDVSLALQRPVASSILNVLPARVDAIDAEDRASSVVRLRCGDDILLARVTNRSLAALQLDAGDAVYAQVKSVTVRR